MKGERDDDDGLEDALNRFPNGWMALQEMQDMALVVWGKSGIGTSLRVASRESTPVSLPSFETNLFHSQPGETG